MLFVLQFKNKNEAYNVCVGVWVWVCGCVYVKFYGAVLKIQGPKVINPKILQDSPFVNCKIFIRD